MEKKFPGAVELSNDPKPQKKELLSLAKYRIVLTCGEAYQVNEAKDFRKKVYEATKSMTVHQKTFVLSNTGNVYSLSEIAAITLVE